MAKDKGTGRTIWGETANAWEGRTRRFLLAPVQEGGKGLSEKHVADIEKQLAANGGRKLKDEPPAPTFIDKVIALDFSDPAEPKEVELTGLPSGKVGYKYFCMVQATGGYEPLLIEGVTLPPGLSINMHGVISGMLLKEGAQEVVVKVTDLFKQTATKTLTIDVAPAEITETPEVEEADDTEAEKKPARPGLMSFLTSDVAAGLMSNAPPVDAVVDTGQGSPATDGGEQGQGVDTAGQENKEQATPSTTVAPNAGQPAQSAATTAPAANNPDTTTAGATPPAPTENAAKEKAPAGKAADRQAPDKTPTDKTK